MNVSFSPPVLYLTDDDTDSEENNEQPASSSYNSLPQKKRKFLDATTYSSPAVVNGTKRQRSEFCQPRPVHSREESQAIVIDAAESTSTERIPHFFDAFDWTNDYPASFTLPTRPPLNVRNFLSAPSESREPNSLMPLIPSTNRFISIPRKTMPFSIDMSSSSPLPLPLPKPTSSLNRAVLPPPLSRAQTSQRIPISYTQSRSPPLASSDPPDLVHPTEARRSALNGTENITAFFDCNSYRCNVCKFHSNNSSSLLQHLFTHMFFCEQCVFYTHSRHSLCEHTFEKHRPKPSTDPRSFDLLFVTRCVDGTFALCMDSLGKNDPPLVVSSKTAPQRKSAKEKKPVKQKRQNKTQASTLATGSPAKEEVRQVYIFMKHRRSYSPKEPTCLHSLSVEYQICREHTIRHMSHTQEILKRRRIRTKLNVGRMIDVIGACLKDIVNNIVSADSDSAALLWPIPTAILDSIFPSDDLNTLLTSLRLTNKHQQSFEQRKYTKAERPLRTSARHVFLFSSPSAHKTEHSIYTAINTSITGVNSPWMQTKLNNLSISLDNTHRFLKGTLNLPAPRTNSLSTNAESNPVAGSPSSRGAHPPALVASRSSPTPCVIVLD